MTLGYIQIAERKRTFRTAIAYSSFVKTLHALLSAPNFCDANDAAVAQLHAEPQLLLFRFHTYLSLRLTGRAVSSSQMSDLPEAFSGYCLSNVFSVSCSFGTTSWFSRRSVPASFLVSPGSLPSSFEAGLSDCFFSNPCVSGFVAESGIRALGTGSQLFLCSCHRRRAQSGIPPPPARLTRRC